MAGLVIHAPIHDTDGRWRLSADIRLGADTLTLTALVSPQTLCWAQQQGMRAARRGVAWASQWGQRLGQWVTLDGDWSAVTGAVGDAAARLARAVASHPLWTYDTELVGAVQLIKDLQSDDPSDQGRATYGLLDLLHRAQLPGRDSAHAVACLDSIQAAKLADDMLCHPNSYTILTEVGNLAKGGDSKAQKVLAAARMIGSCCCAKKHVAISYDAEGLFLDDSLVDAIGYYASDAFAMRGIAPTVEVAQLYRQLLDINKTAKTAQYDTRDRLGGWGYRPEYDTDIMLDTHNRIGNQDVFGKHQSGCIPLPSMY